YCTGGELTYLGEGKGLLPSQATHVYRPVSDKNKIKEELALADSFIRYQKYSKAARIKYAYIAQVFSATVHPNNGDFKRFAELFNTKIGWINQHHRLGIGK